MSQVNLLPSELRHKQAVRRLTAIVAGIGAAVVALIVVFYLLQTMRLSSAEDELALQEQANADLQGEIQELQPYAELQTELTVKQNLVDTLYLNEVSWAGVLLDVSRLIPDESYLTNFSGMLSVPTGTTIGEVPVEGITTGLIGSMSFAGVADGTETIANWLTRLEQVSGWVNPWVNNAAEQGPFSRVYTFDGGVDLTAEATTPRGSGQGRKP